MPSASSLDTRAARSACSRALRRAKDAGLSYFHVNPSAEASFGTPYGIWTKTAPSTAEDVTLPDVPQPRCDGGKVLLEAELWIDVSTGASASGTTAQVTIDGTPYVLSSTSTSFTRWRTIKLDVTGKTTISVRLQRTAGTGTCRAGLNVLGYYA